MSRRALTALSLTVYDQFQAFRLVLACSGFEDDCQRKLNKGLGQILWEGVDQDLDLNLL